MPTIAVTGATGNLGGLVIDHLFTWGLAAADVIPLVRSAEKGERFAARGVAPRVASYDDPAGFKQALVGVDKLVLISPPSLDNAFACISFTVRSWPPMPRSSHSWLG